MISLCQIKIVKYGCILRSYVLLFMKVVDIVRDISVDFIIFSGMLVSESEISGCPYTFRKARFMMPLHRGFWVSLYCIFDGTSLLHCYNQADWVDNAALARELGYKVTTFIHDILVTKEDYPDIFNTIMKYVPRSYFD